MHWRYEDLMDLPADIYEELVVWVRDARDAAAVTASDE
jgi:hypothetical protein